MSELLLEMRGINKTFPGQQVLFDVDFSLLAGETHVLAGENGAGKSTLMRILSGVYGDYDGSIRIRGESVRFNSPQDAARAGVSIIHQELSLIPSMRVSDNIFLGRESCAPGGWLRFGHETRDCNRLLQRLGVQAAPDALVQQYPISIQQTIEIAKALAFDASIIIMDEPTSALTGPEVERLFKVMDDLKRQGCGIIYISHKMEEIYQVADRITVLRDGRLIGVEQADRLSRDELVRWMVGREMKEFLAREPHDPGAVALDVADYTVADPGGRGKPAVSGVSFQARFGEIVGLAGLQGSGADVLMNSLYGMYGQITRGNVTLLGRPYKPHSPRTALKRGLALLTSDRKGEGLIAPMSVTHNITLSALVRHSPGGWLRETRERDAANEKQRVFDIRLRDTAQAVATLSGGNQQKVCLAKCLEARPQVLLLNEPTRGVDIGAKQDIYALMNQWTRENIAIVLITSEMPELIALCDRIIVLHQGVKTASCNRADAHPERILAAAMGKR